MSEAPRDPPPARPGERLAERDLSHPEPVPRRPEPPRRGNRYAWLVGVLLLMAVGVLLFTTALPNTGEGVRGPAAGERLHPFAAPLASGPVEREANVCRARPCSAQAGARPACELRGPGVVNSCQLTRRPLVLTFVFDRSADCFPQVERVERMRAEFPQLSFATLYFTHKQPEEIRRLVETRRWRAPVAIDRDGAVANVLGFGVCPTTVFVERGGRVRETLLGNLTEADLRARARRLIEG